MLDEHLNMVTKCYDTTTIIGHVLLSDKIQIQLKKWSKDKALSKVPFIQYLGYTQWLNHLHNKCIFHFVVHKCEGYWQLFILDTPYKNSGFSSFRWQEYSILFATIVTWKRHGDQGRLQIHHAHLYHQHIN